MHACIYTYVYVSACVCACVHPRVHINSGKFGKRVLVPGDSIPITVFAPYLSDFIKSLIINAHTNICEIFFNLEKQCDFLF